ncbi:prolyl oligopeptidase family serine peptidase [Proteiniclasticum sp. QWL-01]|uniref:alpha/beta hydrolase n=1 Tax=Proteiniclasticum sp. QWL-01 TaxID=3036945 RepID=UPI0021FDA17C|nr:prolyl oligopeptidase family serine peptidase [Proteiniclasticum sp. QWL-01]UUM13248.1 prolyl oligopeptidase family serine peptidase [Clostridiaceae bacterium HFYG-1003]WFF71670.1 prolyl oligopeptidase family serine peptidase [Proteiniclasticum sp. QWL-01]
MPFQTILMILAGLVPASALLTSGGAWLIAERIIHPPKDDYEDIEADLKKRLGYSESEFAQLKSIPYEEVSITSNYGYQINGRLFDLKSDKSVILLHREGRNLIASYKFLQLYRKLGYNVLMCDARYHGTSGGLNYTYGYFERWDLKAQADLMFQRYGSDSLLGFHGESGGAATALMTLYQDERIGFAIADSSFSELLEVMLGLEERLLGTRSKKLLMLIDQIIKRRAGFSLANVSPLTEIQALEVPVLFIHSGADQMVPPKMSKILASFKLGYNEIYIAPDSPHLLGYYQHREEYERRVEAFLDNTENLYRRFHKTYI